MVNKTTLRTCEGKQVLYEKNVKLVTAYDPKEYLKHIKLATSEVPSKMGALYIISIISNKVLYPV